MLLFLKKVLILVLLVTNVTMASCNQSNKKEYSKLESNPMMSLYEAIDQNDVEQVKRIVASNGTLDPRNKKGETPLMYAIYANKSEIALFLIDAGADVNAQDKIQNSPFLYAGAEGKLELVQAALAHGANFTVFNRYGGTALIPAAEKGHLEVVQLLTKTPNFPIDHVNKLGWTALMEAIVLSKGGPVHVQIIQTLIEGGADVHIPDQDGITALQHAKNRNFNEIVTLLKEAGAN